MIAFVIALISLTTFNIKANAYQGELLNQVNDIHVTSENSVTLNITPQSKLSIIREFEPRLDPVKYIAEDGTEISLTNIKQTYNLLERQVTDNNYFHHEVIVETLNDQKISKIIISSSDTFVYEFSIYKYSDVPIEKSLLITNLTQTINNNDVTFTYDLPTEENFSHLELHQDGALLADNIVTSDFTVTGLEFDTSYNYTFYSVDTAGNKSTGVERKVNISSDPALIPSGNIYDIKHSVTGSTVDFTYSLPSDDRFNHLKIYRDNVLITDTYNLNTYTDRNLTPETEFHYRFVSVNNEGIQNEGTSITVVTGLEVDTIAPETPKNIDSKEMNAGLMVSWSANQETDLKGYNVYMNGDKLNTAPIRNNNYSITNLDNGVSYDIQISAVDTSDNESALSLVTSFVPNEEELPIFKLPTNLSSVSGSVSNWFSEIWLIVAFATSIPLSFIIAGRIKSLFIA